MSIALTRLLVDFGLVVLIWMIQLVVYPSFRFFQKEDLMRWHGKYTSALAVIVIPLMFLQLGLSIYDLIGVFSVFNTLSFAIIIALWFSTFLQFVPMHGAISDGIANEKLLYSLVKKNWLRTFLWSSLFIYNLFNYL